MVSCDIFCAVIDNLGDAGVCWRLARQLATEHGWRVRLFIDDPEPVGLIATRYDPVEILFWVGNFADIAPADVVIEAFACHLPPRYIEAMASRSPAPVWINLEYLTAEDWIVGCHGLLSPQDGLSKYFFFPGFFRGTGGLIRERDYAVPPPPTLEDAWEISLFCYDNPALPALLDAWRDSDRPILCHACAGQPHRLVEKWLAADFPPDAVAVRGNLTLHAQPFLPQSGYDALLGRCQLNFVRGEDSFVRAQWAERPFVWQAYPQSADGHLVKLAAFLDRYTKLPAAREFFLAWNGKGSIDWQAFAAILPSLTATAPGWSHRIRSHGDLAKNLVRFCSGRI